MFEMIDRLRKKPREVRERVTVLITFGVLIVLLLVWIPLAMLRFERVSNANKDLQSGETATEISQFFSNLKQQNPFVQQEISPVSAAAETGEIASSSASTTLESQPHL